MSISEAQELLIRHRTNRLKSKNIDPQIYFLAIEYINKFYMFQKFNFFIRTDTFDYSKWERVNFAELVDKIEGYFGIDEDESVAILTFLLDEYALRDVLEQDVNKNWIELTLPDLYDKTV